MVAIATVEICCGSYEDCLAAEKGGAGRVELNTALHMDGLTPSLGSLAMAKANTSLKVVAMLRPRGAGFCYSGDDFRQMLCDLGLLLDGGADGIAFGCLEADGSIDVFRTKTITDMIKEQGREAVFHKAFDCVPDPDAAMEQLIGLGVDRVLTSGLAPKAPQGLDMIKRLQQKYGQRIEILTGGGVNEGNVRHILDYTGVGQVHSSCKAWVEDKTTLGREISFAYAAGENESCYEIVSAEKVAGLVRAANG